MLPIFDAPALDRAGVSARDGMGAIEAALAALGRGAVQQPQPPALAPGGGAFFQPLLAALPEANLACVNWLSFHPRNSALGRPHSGGLLILSDFGNGAPLCLMNGIWIGHRRTGYVAGIGAKFLAGPIGDIALIGPGAIAPFAMEALAALDMTKGRVRVCGRRLESARSFCAIVTARLGIDAVPFTDPRAAVDGARLVITATSHAGPPFLERDWLAGGTLVVLIDRLRVTTPELLAQADRIVTNNRASLAQWGVEREREAEDFPGIVAAGKPKPVRSGEVVLYDAGGLGVADLALAALVWRRLGGAAAAR